MRKNFGAKAILYPMPVLIMAMTELKFNNTYIPICFLYSVNVIPAFFLKKREK